jgi:hypothetical protein
MILTNPISITIQNKEARMTFGITLFDLDYYKSKEFPSNITIEGLSYESEKVYTYEDIIKEISENNIWIEDIFIETFAGSKMNAYQTLHYFELYGDIVANKAHFVPLFQQDFASRYIFNTCLKASSRLILNMYASTGIRILLKSKV